MKEYYINNSNILLREAFTSIRSVCKYLRFITLFYVLTQSQFGEILQYRQISRNSFSRESFEFILE